MGQNCDLVCGEWEYLNLTLDLIIGYWIWLKCSNHWTCHWLFKCIILSFMLLYEEFGFHYFFSMILLNSQVMSKAVDTLPLTLKYIILFYHLCVSAYNFRVIDGDDNEIFICKPWNRTVCVKFVCFAFAVRWISHPSFLPSWQ